MPRPWISPKATFSHTGRLSNNAAPWNSMPNFFITRSRAAPLIWVMSSPSTRMVPSSGRMMPRMDLMVTDLPVPEPPMITSEDCWLDGQVHAVQHHLGAEALLDADELDFRRAHLWNSSAVRT